MRAGMTTGGRGITRDLARRAADAGLEQMSVSIDGLEVSHDRLRGASGAWRQALEALRHAREAGIAIGSNTQVNRLSAPELDPLLDVLAAAGIRSWQVQMTAPLGRAADVPEILLQPWELLDVFPRLAAVAERARTLGIRFWPGNNLGYFGPFETVLRADKRSRHRGSCGAGRAVIGIEANGAVKGCPSLPSEAWVGGNVRDASLRDIWERAEPLRFTRGGRAREALWGYCAECYYAEACLGGCTFTAAAFSGRPGNNPYCHHRALEMQARGVRERVIRTESAPGLPFDHARFEIVQEPLR